MKVEIIHNYSKVRNIKCQDMTMKKSKFGKPSLNHTFTSEATFEHILIFLLRSKYLPSRDENILLNTHPLFKHLNDTPKWSSCIEFMDLKNPIENYQDQKTINIARVGKC